MSLVAQLDMGRSDRVPLDREATLRDLAKAPADVVVDNLSRSGCLFVLESDLPLGALISIGIPGIGLRYARVSRVDHPHYACAFLTPITDAEIVAALSADTLVVGAFPQMPEPAVVAPVLMPAVPEPDDATPPLGVRVAVIVGASVSLWAGLVAAVMSLR